MASLDPPPRRARKFWGDARFLLGIVLIGLSIAGVWLVVTAARQTTPVYAATRTIVPGEAIAGDDLRVVDVALGQVGESYLRVPLTEGLVATRTIGAGELIPSEAAGSSEEVRTTRIVIRTASEVPISVSEGSRVEVWHAPPLDREAFDEPRILLPEATVAAVTRDDSMVGGADATLEVVIPRADVAAALAAQSDGSILSVVPVAGASG